jgi:hypothetical protein
MNKRVLTCLVCLLTLAGAAHAAAPLAERLPAGTKMYVGWAGRTLPFDGSMLGQLINEPAVKTIFAAIRDSAMKEIHPDQEREMFRCAWEMASIAWQRPMAVALMGLTPNENDEPTVSAVLLVDLGKDKAAFEKHLVGLLAALDDEVTFTNATAGSLSYRTYKNPHENDVSLGYMGNVFFCAIGTKTPGQLVAVTAAKSLKANKKFAANFKVVDGENVQFAMYVDVDAVQKNVEKVLEAGGPNPPTKGKTWEQELQRFAQALGVEKIASVAGTTRVVDRGMLTKVRLQTPAPHTGLLLPLAGKPLQDADLAGVPADADFVLATTLSADALYTELRRVIKTLDEDADKDFARELGEVEDEFGVSLKKDILANLGDRCVLASAPSLGGFLTGTVLIVQVKDAKKLQAGIAKLETAIRKKLTPPPPQPTGFTCPMHTHLSIPAPGKCPMCGMDLMPADRLRRSRRGPPASLETVKVGRTQIRYVAFSTRDPIPFAPAWAIHKDKLYIAGWPQVIQTAIESPTRTPITQDPAFRKARAKVGANASILLYANYPRIVRQVYNWGLLGWTAGANVLPQEMGIQARPDWLPALSKLEKYLWPQVGAVSADAKGITFEGYGSLPAPDMLLSPLPAALSSIAIPALYVAKRRAVDVTEMHKVRMIHIIAMQYANDHAGKLPESLMQEKLADYIEGGKNSPLWRDIKAGKYTYLGAGKAIADVANPSKMVLLYVNADPEGNTVIVCFLDGTVRRMPRLQFRQVLAESQQGGK